MTHDVYLCRIQKACHASETMTQTICVKEGAVASKVREALREPSNDKGSKNFLAKCKQKTIVWGKTPRDWGDDPIVVWEPHFSFSVKMCKKLIESKALQTVERVGTRVGGVRVDMALSH